MSGEHIRANDVVVCIDDSPNPLLGSSLVKRGNLYRVTGLAPPKPCAHCGFTEDSPGVHLQGIQLPHPWGHCDRRFEKLLPAEPCFTEALRSFVAPEPTEPDLVAELQGRG